jgi:DNA-directed RNA polymerase subunit alpha
MNAIALPKNIEFQNEGENRALVTVSPCFPGYGITLGNALRRVLLSSLPGAAVVGVKIEGVDHEFMALSHLKEDILEFILNLKLLNLNVYSEGTEKLELAVHGKKEITAADIKKNSNVKIANEDLVLGHITDMAGKLKAEIFVSQGMGYETLESRDADIEVKDRKPKEIGYIEMDSIFSPVLSTGIRVDNMRVGKMTNWDKLVLDIKTDGTITPEEAFYKSVEILISQFTALSLEKETAKQEAVVAAEEVEAVVSEAEEEPAIIEDDTKKRRGRPKKS